MMQLPTAWELDHALSRRINLAVRQFHKIIIQKKHPAVDGLIRQKDNVVIADRSPSSKPGQPKLSFHSPISLEMAEQIQWLVRESKGPSRYKHPIFRSMDHDGSR
jgi:hypothetical protein